MDLRPGLLRLKKLIRPGLRPSQLSAYLYVINFRIATAYLRIRLFNTSFHPYALRHGFFLAPAPKTAPKFYGAAFLSASILHNAPGIMPHMGQGAKGPYGPQSALCKIEAHALRVVISTFANVSNCHASLGCLACLSSVRVRKLCSHTLTVYYRTQNAYNTCHCFACSIAPD